MLQAPRQTLWVERVSAGQSTVYCALGFYLPNKYTVCYFILLLDSVLAVALESAHTRNSDFGSSGLPRRSALQLYLYRYRALPRAPLATPVGTWVACMLLSRRDVQALCVPPGVVCASMIPRG